MRHGGTRVQQGKDKGKSRCSSKSKIRVSYIQFSVTDIILRTVQRMATKLHTILNLLIKTVPVKYSKMKTFGCQPIHPLINKKNALIARMYVARKTSLAGAYFCDYAYKS